MTVLSPNEVHVILVNLDESAPLRGNDLNILSDAERARASSLRFPMGPERYLASKIALRQVLSGYLNVSPEDIVFEHSDRGKPRITSPETKIQFNVSHSDKWALIAIADSFLVGVDIERVDPARETLKIAERFFAPHEFQELVNLPPGSGLQDAFTKAWVVKEAYVKATGDGVSYGLDRVLVSRDPDTSLYALCDCLGWTSQALIVPPDYRGAVVAKARDYLIKQMSA